MKQLVPKDPEPIYLGFTYRIIKFGLVWFIGFYGKSTFVGYLMPNPFLCKYSVLFKQFSLA